MSAAAEAPRLRRRGRAVRTVAGTVAVLALAGGVAWILVPGPNSPAPAVNDQVPLGSAAVERRDLIDRQDVDGTLGYAGTQTVTAPAAGTITRLRPEGATVARGRSLLSIDAKATGWVLYGSRPMYRDLGPGVTDGSDVRQLESNLAALGYDPGTVDADWTWQTTAAVKAFQKDRSLTENGTLRRADVIVSDGPARVGAHKAEVGDQARPGAPVTQLTSTTPVATSNVDAGIAASVSPGDAVTVTLPDGRTVRGTITKVGTVATPGQNGAAPTVPLDVALRSRRHGRLDGAPVTLSLAIGQTKNALAVPVTALVATGPSEYAVQLAGSRRLVRVTLGASADGWTQVTGAGLTAGTRVVVPR
jgi:peptidoglycan hydrolase-like protein with peptidoglycan-binding domain